VSVTPSSKSNNRKFSYNSLNLDCLSMLIPKNVSKLLNEKEKNIKKMVNHLSIEKKKIDSDID